MALDFSLTPEQSDMQNITRKFVKNEMSPFAAKHDKEGTFPTEIFQKIFQLGMMNPRIPREYGGSGLPLLEECLLIEEFAYGCAGMTTTMIATSTALDTIIRYGNEEQKKKFLKPFSEELRFASFCLTEPKHGSDVSSIATTAKPEGSAYVLNGSKSFIVNAPYSSIFVVFSTVDINKKRGGITAFIVPKESGGIVIGREHKKLGHIASSTADVTLNNVKIPAENRLGNEGEGFNIALSTLNRGRLLIASAAVGLARAALDNALDYSLKRVQFNQPIAMFEATQLKLASMAQDLSASRLLVMNAAWRIDSGEEAIKESVYAKCFATDNAMRTAIETVQIYGGYGYTKEYPAEKLMRDAKLLQIIGGTNEILRLNAARQLIKGRA